MNDLNIVSILYISFRLAPFILVSFFSLSSIINQDIKGLIYLSGLLISCFFAVIIGNTFSSIFEIAGPPEDQLYQNTTHVCNLMTLSKSGPLSNLPLSQVVFTYTFGYLLFVIVKYKLITQNLPTIIIFPILIIADFMWHSSNSCSKPASILAAIIIGGLTGIAWSYIIDSTKLKKLQYFNGLSNKETCSLPSKQLFRCRNVSK
jgi:uncharacterized membrane protein